MPTPSSGTRATSSTTASAWREAARAHRRDSLERLAAERANLRLAYERLLRAGAVDEALRVAIAFAQALPWDAHTHEVRGWLAGGLAALGEDARAARHRAVLGRPARDLAGALRRGRAAARARSRPRARRATASSRPAC